MRDLKIYDFRRALPRMSWAPQNLYNMWQRSLGQKKDEISIRDHVLSHSIFQQRWIAKTLVRAYHGDFINEGVFKRWYIPDTLPDVRPRKVLSQQSIDLKRWSRKDDAAGKEEKQREENNQKGFAPVGSLMFAEVERRLDVIIFRACMARSVYDARRLVIHGKVLLNGKKHTAANTRLAPGDMVTVDPAAIPFLQRPARAKAKETSDAKASSESESSETDESGVFSTKPILKEDSKYKQTQTYFKLPSYAAPFIFIPAYLEVSFATCSAIYLRHPTARPGYSELPTPYAADGDIINFAWEWYVHRRPRIRSKRQLAREPGNRQPADL